MRSYSFTTAGTVLPSHLHVVVVVVVVVVIVVVVVVVLVVVVLVVTESYLVVLHSFHGSFMGRTWLPCKVRFGTFPFGHLLKAEGL